VNRLLNRRYCRASANRLGNQLHTANKTDVIDLDVGTSAAAALYTTKSVMMWLLSIHVLIIANINSGENKENHGKHHFHGKQPISWKNVTL
jgi:hypothetical protein